MREVCVLMSSYNGAPFIREQIDSIIGQKEVGVKLIVRDDGSKDNTIDILKEYSNKGLLEYVAGKNVGYVRSFFELLKAAPACDYYAFSDQDDIWQENKLITAVSSLKKMNGKNRLYCSNLDVYVDGRVLGQMRPLDISTNEYECLNRSICTGCTMVFDNDLKELVLENLPDTKVIPVHDLWIFHTAIYLGSLFYDKRSLIKYRQHGSNQIGAKFSKKIRFQKKLRSLKNLPEQHFKEIEAKLLLEKYSQYLTEEQIKIISKVACYKTSYYNKLILLFDKRYRTDIWDKVRILLGVY